MAAVMADHPAKDIMESMWREGARAKEIFEWLGEQPNWPLVKYETIAKYGQRNWSEKAVARSVVETVDESTEQIEDLITEIQDKGGVVTKVVVNKKPRLEWDKSTGENIQVTRDVVEQRVEFVPESTIQVVSKEDPIIERAAIPNIKIASKPLKSRSKPFGMNLAVSIPDMQIGALDVNREALEPTQDEQAIDVGFQVMSSMEKEHGIDLIVNQGDNLDFPAFSSHRSPPGYVTQVATQYAIDRYATILATQRSIAPNAKIVDLPSNHVIRLTNILIDKIPALVGIRRAGEETPLLSISYLCRYDDYNIEAPPGGYPDGKYWASDNLLFVHGDKTSATPGATANKYLKDGVSVVYGHHHHEELLRRVSEVNGTQKVSFAGSAGCLCSVQGNLPSAKTGSDESGRLAGVQREPWNQGIWFIWYDPDGIKDPILEICQIEQGKAVFRGVEYETTVDKFGEKL